MLVSPAMSFAPVNLVISVEKQLSVLFILETDMPMRSIAKRLIFRAPTAAKRVVLRRSSLTELLVNQGDAAGKRKWSIL